jgi:hypothetical protein
VYSVVIIIWPANGPKMDGTNVHHHQPYDAFHTPLIRKTPSGLGFGVTDVPSSGNGPLGNFLMVQWSADRRNRVNRQITSALSKEYVSYLHFDDLKLLYVRRKYAKQVNSALASARSSWLASCLIDCSIMQYFLGLLVCSTRQGLLDTVFLDCPCLSCRAGSWNKLPWLLRA